MRLQKATKKRILYQANQHDGTDLNPTKCRICSTAVSQFNQQGDRKINTTKCITKTNTPSV